MASIELRNRSSRPVTYWAPFHPETPEYALLYQSPAGWKPDQSSSFCCTGMKGYTLAPSQVLTFQAAVDRDKPCRVSLSYTEGRTPSRVWKHLPSWITQNVPWVRTREWSTITTETIDLQGAVGLPIKQE